MIAPAARRHGVAWRGGRNGIGSLRQALVMEHLVFGTLLLLLTAAFVLGGSARSDVLSLLVLRPVSVIALALALAGLTRKHTQGYILPISIACAAVMLPALQLLPLPPGLWQDLPGRDLLVAIDQAAGLGVLWRPLTLTPPETLDALLSGFVPLAVMLLAIQLAPRRRATLVLVAIAFGAASAFLGLLQVLGDPQGPLYLIQVTNNGASVGFFANRNHHAVALACLLPLVFAAVSLPEQPASRRVIFPAWRIWTALAGACFLVPLVLAVGSRAGLIALAMALASLPLLVRRRMQRDASAIHRAWLPIGTIALASIAAAAVWLGRDEALDRLVASSPADEIRIRILPILQDMASQHLIWGTGMGSFERVYQIVEPGRLLMPSYMNHAHNDWLELVITGGSPALAILLVAIVVLGLRAFRILLKEGDAWQPLRRAAFVCIVILGLSSIYDYPLRTPFLASLLALCAVWLFMPTATREHRHDRLAVRGRSS